MSVIRRPIVEPGSNTQTVTIWLNTIYACGALITQQGIIIDSCPIYKWMRGKQLWWILNYLEGKGQLIEHQRI